ARRVGAPFGGRNREAAGVGEDIQDSGSWPRHTLAILGFGRPEVESSGDMSSQEAPAVVTLIKEQTSRVTFLKCQVELEPVLTHNEAFLGGFPQLVRGGDLLERCAADMATQALMVHTAVWVLG